MRKRTSQILKRAFFLLAILAVIAYLFVPKIVINFMEDVSVTEVEEFDNLPAPEREVEEIEIITDEEIQITETKEQETIYINEEEETPGKEAKQKELSHKENAEREAARHKRMQSSIEKFLENIKSPDW